MTVASINGVTSANISKINGLSASAIASVMGQTLSPPLPDFTNVAAAWGLNNWNPVGYPAGAGVVYSDDTEVDFLPPAPYSLEWTSVSGGDIALTTWYDQNAQANNLAAAGAARPTLDATNKWIAFSNAQGLVGASQLYVEGTTTATIYFDVQPFALDVTGVILETGTGAVDQARRISISQVANQLLCAVFDNTALVCLANSKTYTLPNTNRLFGCFQIDTTQGTAANQTALFINNSSSGVTSPLSTNVNGLVMGAALPSVGARDAGGTLSAGFKGNMWNVIPKTGVDDAAARLAYYTYDQYLQTQ